VRLSNKILAAYSLPAVPLAMLISPIIIYLPAYYAEHIGIGLSALGVIFFIGRLWDGVTDPIVGRLSDMWQSRFGRRKPWVVAGSPFLIVATYFLCRPPQDASVIYLLVALVAFYVAYTVVRIPYISWGAELSPSYTERNRIAGLRELGTMVGIFISVSAPYFLLGGENASLDGIMLVFTISVTILMPIAALAAAKFVPDKAAGVVETPSLRQEFSVVWRNKPYMRILTAQMILYLGTYMYNAAMVFLIEGPMGLKGKFLSLIMIEYTAMILFVPVLIWVSNYLNKHRVIALGILLQMTALAVMGFATPGCYWQAAVAFVLVGISFSSWYIIPTSMIADTVDYGKMRGGADSAGVYMALFNFIDKLGLALAALITLPLLDFLGFNPQGENTGMALYSVKIVGVFMPMAIIFIAVLIYWNYPIDRRKHNAVIRYNARRERRHAG
jgi:GPH family glycoside/pentoside/hexuronide:cation symporter